MFDNNIVEIDNMMDNIVTLLFAILSNVTKLLLISLHYSYIVTILWTIFRAVMAKAVDEGEKTDRQLTKPYTNVQHPTTPVITDAQKRSVYRTSSIALHGTLSIECPWQPNQSPKTITSLKGKDYLLSNFYQNKLLKRIY